jgi:hypothetical protein
MGFVTQFFIKPRKTALIEFPRGSFTVDSGGKVLTSSLPRSFVNEHVQAIATTVLAAQKSARQAQLPISELVVSFQGLRLVARDMRGGAIVFLERQVEIVQPPQSIEVDEHFGDPPPPPRR